MAEDRKAHWEQVYTQRAADEVGWFQPHPERSLQLIHRYCPDPQARIIDVGGGASRLIDHLLLAGYRRPAVLDIATAALEQSRARLGVRAADVTWYESDVTDFAPPHAFDLWHDRAVFHFLTDAADRKRYVQTLTHALAPRAHVIIAAFAPGGPPQCSNLDVRHYDAALIRAELGAAFELLEAQSELHTTPHGKVQPFMYFVLRRMPAAQ